MSRPDSAVSLLPDYSLRAHNTFGFDARARVAARIGSPGQFASLARDPRVAGLDRLVLGGGSNVVFTRDFDGLVLLDEIRGRALVREDDGAWYVEAGGGENWHAFVEWTLAEGMPGLENLALIPGTVGAAPIQNIGAYGLEMKGTSRRCARSTLRRASWSNSMRRAARSAIGTASSSGTGAAVSRSWR